jgi:hypothetical protein
MLLIVPASAARISSLYMNATPTTPTASPASVWASKSTLLWLLIAVGLYVFLVFPMMEADTNPLDEGMLLVYPELLSKGALPQRDYETMYPPGGVWALAGAYKVMGADIFTERTVGMLYQALLICGIYCLLVPRGKTTALTGCLLSTVILSRIGFVALAWFGAVACGALCLAVLTRPGDLRRRAIVAGALAGIAVTWRLDIAPALILALGAYCVLSRWRWQDWLRLALSGLISLIPLLVHIVVVTPAAFFTKVFYDPVIRGHGARSLPLDYAGAYAAELYVLVVLGIAAAITVGWMFRRDQEKDGLALFVAGLFALGLIHEGLQRGDSAHFTLVAIFAAPLLAFAASMFSRSWVAPVLAGAAVLFCVPQDLAFLHEIHSRDSGSLWVKNGDRQVTGNLEEQCAVDYLQAHASSGQRLFVGTQDLRFATGNNVAFYYLFPQLRPATYFIEFEPQVTNRAGSRLAADIQTADWVVLDRTWQDTPEPNASRIAGPAAPNDVIRKDFQLVYSSGAFRVYKRFAS